MSSLNVTRRDSATGPVLDVTGSLDYDHAATLRHEVRLLALDSGQCLSIDLSGLDFCDSSGISALLAARQHALSAGADMALLSVPANTLRIMTMVGLNRVFTIRPGTA
ncbi:STAS domain-containing protein [Nocardiopsis akebiae]|uniref:Anti-sigma factor antagonist n=1 Tax=Nocardiopsis akebiae TaxID=2831968 RepID=A0ABX8C9Z1_9ACTN|nr:STAS domain-containing protein [Nocardiopsis akebiae]QUX31226.1 STAS domain-containing protein [Nocardiopsis akebiae]